MRFAMCRREDMIRRRWDKTSVTGTGSVLIILGQKVKLEQKVAKIVFKRSACSFKIVQRLQVVSISLKIGFKPMTVHKPQAVSWELLGTLVSACCSQSSAPSILLVLKPRASSKAHCIASSLVQWTKGGRKLSIKILHVPLVYSLDPVQPACSGY